MELDTLNQCVTLAMHAEEWRDGTLCRASDHLLTYRPFLHERAAADARALRLTDVVVEGDHSDLEATSDDDFLVFVARKQ